jgi:hypothetical protein
MRVQSIGTAVEPRYPTGDRFLGTARQVAFRKVNCITEGDHFPQKVGPVAETLEDARHLLPAGFRAPRFIDLGDFAGGSRVFDEGYFLILIRHAACHPIESESLSDSLAC